VTPQRPVNSPTTNRTGSHVLVVTAVYVLATVYFTWPLADLSADRIFPRGSPDDILLVLWILAWDVHALATDPGRLFDGNILHPARQVLAHSEHLLGTLPIFAPVMAITGDPVAALNVMMLGSFLLGGLFMHALIWSWTGSMLAAYVAGLCFAFAPWRINGLNWPHLLSTQYLPLVVLGLERSVKTRSVRAILILAAALSLQLLCSYYLAYMVALVAGTFVAMYALCDPRARRRDVLTALTVGIVPAVAILLAASLPYFELYQAGHFLRPSMDDETVLEVLGTFGRPALITRSFVGWGPAVLALLALAPALSTRADWVRARVLALAFLFACALAISAGPVGLFGGTLPFYSWLAAVVPGFSLIRVPFRFGILASFAVAALAGLGVWWVSGYLRAAPRSVLYVFAAASIFLAVYPGLKATAPASSTVPTRENLPQVYTWLAANGRGGPLLELPMQERRALTAWQWDRPGARAAYFSVYHWLPLLNGYTGYTPPAARAVEEMANRLPSQGDLEALVNCTGVRWILVHRLGPSQEQAWQKLRGVRLVSRFAASPHDDGLFEVAPRSSDRCTDARFQPPA
jgi:hypothetical protein